MAKYDGLIIPRSYNDYINKSDPLAVTQALQLTGVMDNVPTAQSTKPAKSGGIFAANAVIMASSATLTGVAISAGSVVRVMFTAALTGSDTKTGLTLTYNGTAYAVKVGKNGALANFNAYEVESGVFKYLQAYTTLELMFDGTQFIIIGNPVVVSSADYTIYADGYLKSSTLDNTSNIPTKSLIYNLFFDNSPEKLSDLRLNNRDIMLNSNRNKIPIIRLIDSETLNKPDDSITQGALIIIATKNQGLNAHILVTLDNYTSTDAYKVRMYIRSAWWNGTSVSYTIWKTVVN